jgi:hypothetical protein
MPEIIGPFINGLARFLFAILKDRVEQSTREQRDQAQTEQLRRSEAVRIAAAKELAEYQAEAQIRQVDRKSLVLRYPLGEPGRLRQHYQKSSTPCIMIASLPLLKSEGAYVGNDVFEMLSDLPEAIKFFQAMPDAVVADRKKIRQIGRADVVEMAALEFPTQAAIIVFFEKSVGGIASHAYFWKMFPTTTGDSGFFVRIARYRSHGKNGSRLGDIEMQRPNLAMLSFSDIDLPRSRQHTLEVVSRTVAFFLAASLDMYWYTNGRRTDLFNTLATIHHGGGHSPEAVSAETTSRISDELATLRQAGFNCEHMEIESNKQVILVELQSGSLLLILPATFPNDPPEVRVTNENGPAVYDFEDGSWTRNRTLAEIVGAFNEI